jgi:hypothetical protein
MNMYVIDKEKLNDLKVFADQNRIAVDELLDIYNGRELPVGERPGFTIFLPIDLKVVFCIEYQKQGWARHLSMSQRDKLPHPEAVNMVMKELGFKSNFYDKEAPLWRNMNEEHNYVEVVEYL